MGRIATHSGVWSDFTYSFRALRTQRAFSFTAVTTLALGIGANRAIFSVVYAVLLSPLPFPKADQIVAIHNVFEHPFENRAVICAADFLDFRAAQLTMTDEVN